MFSGLNSIASKDSIEQPQKLDGALIKKISPLHYAILRDDLPEFEHVLAKDVCLEEKIDGDTPLLAVAKNLAVIGHSEQDCFKSFTIQYKMLLKLLYKGADWSAVDSSSQNIFHIICGNITFFCNHLSICESKLAEEKFNSEQKIMISQDRNIQFFQFFLEAKFNDKELAKLKLSLEAVKQDEKKTYYSIHYLNTPLQRMLRYYSDNDFYFEFFKVFLKVHLKVNANLHPHHEGNVVSPLMLGAREGDKRIVDLLIDAGMDMFETRGNGVPNAAQYADLCCQYTIANHIKHRMFESKMKEHNKALYMGLHPRVGEGSALFSMKKLGAPFSVNPLKMIFEISNQDLISEIFGMTLKWGKSGTGSPSYYDNSYWEEVDSINVDYFLNEIQDMSDPNNFDQEDFIFFLKGLFTSLFDEVNKSISTLKMRAMLSRIKENQVKESKDTELYKKVEELPQRLKYLKESCAVDVYLIDKKKMLLIDFVNKVYKSVNSTITHFDFSKDISSNPESFIVPQLKTIPQFKSTILHGINPLKSLKKILEAIIVFLGQVENDFKVTTPDKISL